MTWNHSIQHFSIIERLARRFRPRSALDVGSGDGMLADLLTQFVPRVVGVDSDAGQVAAASRRYPTSGGLAFELCDVMHEVPVGAPFALVACSATLHHLPLEAALARLSDLTAPGGTLVVVGLAREHGPLDWAFSLTSIPLNRVARARRGWYDHGAPMRDATDTYATVFRAARRLLPGVRIRRRLYWRYSLVWHRPAVAR